MERLWELKLLLMCVMTNQVTGVFVSGVKLLATQKKRLLATRAFKVILDVYTYSCMHPGSKAKAPLYAAVVLAILLVCCVHASAHGPPSLFAI